MVRIKPFPPCDESPRRKQQEEEFHLQAVGLTDKSPKEQCSSDRKRKLETSIDGSQNKVQKTGETNDECSSDLYKNIDLTFSCVEPSSLKWRKIIKSNLNLDYTQLFPHKVADTLMHVFENEIEYFTGTLAKVKVFGKWHDIPRKQVRIILNMQFVKHMS